jgi:hypothetical protein
MSNTVLSPSIDCADAAKLAHFWADVLGRETDRLLCLGATRANEIEKGGARWTTFRDPRATNSTWSPAEPDR